MSSAGAVRPPSGSYDVREKRSSNPPTHAPLGGRVLSRLSSRSSRSSWQDRTSTSPVDASPAKSASSAKKGKCVCVCHDESNDGIPSFCKGAASVWCPLHPSNPLLATNKYVLMFGNLGLPHFDRHRRHYQGLALGWTILAFFFTVFGALGNVNDKSLMRISFWAWGRTYSDLFRKDEEGNFAEVWIGLRGFSARNCLFIEETDEHPDPAFTDDLGGIRFNCTHDVYAWEDPESLFTPPQSEAQEAQEEYQDAAFGRCRQTCLGAWGGLTLSCITMCFAMIGSTNRMRFAADSPQQKILGCFPETLGAVTLFLSLIDMDARCLTPLVRKYSGDYQDFGTGMEYDKMNWLRGGGFWAYWAFCFSGCCIRALIHWLTPLPGMGVGAFTFRLPEMDGVVHGANIAGKLVIDGIRDTGIEVGEHVKTSTIDVLSSIGQAVSLSKTQAKKNRKLTATHIPVMTEGIKGAGGVLVRKLSLAPQPESNWASRPPSFEGSEGKLEV
ncbi:hypothetical protein TeGR_g11749 [Tetraparma gracilis]|uniref:Uncharacterized protein n=1 Tax=Tetraparma gracilis TaxID=2962635 RepID=A0ABQ6MQD7_9STRA|nr:hypothetical protein TeGR_g11749 [Tetraparma gracilis]